MKSNPSGSKIYLQEGFLMATVSTIVSDIATLTPSEKAVLKYAMK